MGQNGRPQYLVDGTVDDCFFVASSGATIIVGCVARLYGWGGWGLKISTYYFFKFYFSHFLLIILPVCYKSCKLFMSLKIVVNVINYHF